MHLSSKGAGMDIHTYLDEWHSIEPNRCAFVKGDLWKFHFNDFSEPVKEYPSELTCNVMSFYGVEVIEDLIKACVDERTGWQYKLEFDRDEELFLGYITHADGNRYMGLESLNPGIALLTAYLNTLKNQG